MSKNNATVTAKPTTPKQETSRTSILTKLRDCFAKKVDKDTYDAVLNKYNNLKEEYDALKSDYKDLGKVLAEIESIIDEADNNK